MSIRKGNSIISGGGSAASIDNISITKNDDRLIQAIGIINDNNTSTSIKTWVGTRVQFDEISVKDSNTIYNITDDVMGGDSVYSKSDVNTLLVNLVDSIYPVNSIYIGVQSVCPISILLPNSTWELVGSDKVLQGAGTRGAVNTTISESLPNIKGKQDLTWNDTIGNYGSVVINNNSLSTGAFGTDTRSGNITWASSNQTSVNLPTVLTFDANKSNNIYQDNAHVQPDAYVVNIWKRTA